MLADELQINSDADFIDWGHTNTSGATKVTGYIGKYLKKNFDLPDHRGEKKYKKWDLHAAICEHETQNYKMLQREDIYYFLNACKTLEDYTIFMTANGEYKNEEGDIESWVEDLGIKEQFDKDGGVWIFRNGELVESYEWKEKKQYGSIGKVDYLIEKTEDGPVLKVNKLNGLKFINGINMVFYDELNERVVDIIGFDAPREYAGAR